MRFRTQFLPIWHDVDDPELMRAVTKHAKALAIRVRGLLSYDDPWPADPESWETWWWERSVARLVPHLHVAFIQLHLHVGRDTSRRHRPLGLHRVARAIRTWAKDADEMTDLCRQRLRFWRGAYVGPIVLQVEDYSARWALASGFKPDVWLMDTPLVARDEARDRWRGTLSRPGVLRRSILSREWGALNLHFGESESLAHHLPATRRLADWGYWRSPAKFGPLLDSIPETSHESDRVRASEHGRTGRQGGEPRRAEGEDLPVGVPWRA